MSFRAKLLVGHVTLVLLVGLAVMLELNQALAADMRAQLERRLAVQAVAASQWIDQNRHPEKLVRRLSAVVSARVTLLDATGTTIADSDSPDGSPGDVPLALDEHAVAQALTGSEGIVVRLSTPLSEIDATLADMRARLAFASALGIAAAIALGILASRLAARPLRAMTAAADRIARGEYRVSLPTKAPDEFGVLARALASLAAKLEADMDRINRLERVRRDFVANVSHELRTPVTAIQGFAETLLDAPDDPTLRRQFLEAIHRHSLRLAALVSGLLRLSSLEARAPEERVTEPVDVQGIARHAVLSAASRAVDSGKELTERVEPGLYALGDPLGVEQVIDNLLDNALRHGGATIRIEGERRGERALLRVIDDGGGIDTRHLPRLFERFYRVPEASPKGGTGLGLAIAKHVCESMGGTIAVRSAPGETIFEIDLPAASPTDA